MWQLRSLLYLRERQRLLLCCLLLLRCLLLLEQQLLLRRAGGDRAGRRRHGRDCRHRRRKLELVVTGQRRIKRRGADERRLRLPLVVDPRLPDAGGELRRRHAVEQLDPPLLLAQTRRRLRVPRIVAVPSEPAVLAVDLLEGGAAVDALRREAVRTEARACVARDRGSAELDALWGRQPCRVDGGAGAERLLGPAHAVPRLPHNLGKLWARDGAVEQLEPAALEAERGLALRVPSIVAVVGDPPVGVSHRAPARPAVDGAPLDQLVEAEALVGVGLGGAGKQQRSGGWHGHRVGLAALEVRLALPLALTVGRLPRQARQVGRVGARVEQLQPPPALPE
mmetsp:Transcript_32218/g.70568  ORF Transcript_32218/g.70568 Transcript_32218/m.70568 type:complete len:338 (+) Transcript_32218:1358-2371(+)